MWVLGVIHASVHFTYYTYSRSPYSKHGRHRNIFQGAYYCNFRLLRQNKWIFIQAEVKQIVDCSHNDGKKKKMQRHFRLIFECRCLMLAPMAQAKKFWAFYRGRVYDVNIFKFLEEGSFTREMQVDNFLCMHL